MKYEFLNNSLDKENIILPESEKINRYLLENNHSEIVKALDFLESDEKFLYIHGFMGTGKRQFVNYLDGFLNKDVIKLEYYCREATVNDDILLNFTEIIDSDAISTAININAKITTLNARFSQQISSIRKPFLIILHMLDNIQDENIKVIAKTFSDVLREENVKVIVTTRALKPAIIENREYDREIFLKAFSEDIFKEYLKNAEIDVTDKKIEDFYKVCRGYYFYTAISAKIMQANKLSLAEFLSKFEKSGMSFDSYLASLYIDLVPNTVRNFFWFLRTIRHGISINALAVLDIYDEFSVEYLKSNLIVFQSGDMIYLHDYFIQKIDLIIPEKTEIKLHKFIIKIYEDQLKEPLKTRAIFLSRQALRSEIEYHKGCIEKIENGKQEAEESQETKAVKETNTKNEAEKPKTSFSDKIKQASKLFADKKYTEAIELYTEIISDENIDLTTLVECRLSLARIYVQIEDYKMAEHYYELVGTFYKHNNEQINLNYLYYELTDLYYKMYKHERAIETIKKVIYSVDTPQSLMVSACTLLGNIYTDINNPNEAFSYYKKALDSLDENVDNSTLAELYFKFALANDEREEYSLAFEYYNKCTDIDLKFNPYKSLSYSNMASCYYEKRNYDDAINCFLKSYELEKDNNNFDGIYYTASNIAKIYIELGSKKALDYLKEAKKSAEFLNEQFYILESAIALGDYYYDLPDKKKEALTEYMIARKTAYNMPQTVDISKIEQRIQDMKFRMPEKDFEKIEQKYEK